MLFSALILGFAGLVLIGIAIQYWRGMFFLVLFMIVCEGAVRKWIFPGAQAEIYLVKDAVVLAAYIGFLCSRVSSGPHLAIMTGLKTLMLLSLAYFAVQVFNPNSPSLLLSVVGFKNYLLYMPLVFVVPYMFTSSADLERKLKKYALIMLPFAGLGLVQFMFGADHWINGYLSYDSENLREAALFGGGEELFKARTSGTFSYIGGYVTFLTVICYLVMGLLASKRWRISGNTWLYCLLIVTFAAMFTTGSRTPIYGLIFTTPFIALVWKRAGLISGGDIARLCGIAIVVFLFAQLVASDAISAYQARADNSDNPLVRVLSPITEVYEAFLVSPIIGTGMASTASSAGTIMGTLQWWWLNGNFFELETARVLQETGVIGFILVYAIRVWLLLKALKLAMWFKTPLYVAISSVIIGFLTQSLALFVINNLTAGYYYWFSAGLLFAMYRLELAGARSVQRPSTPKRVDGIAQPAIG